MGIHSWNNLSGKQACRTPFPPFLPISVTHTAHQPPSVQCHQHQHQHDQDHTSYLTFGGGGGDDDDDDCGGSIGGGDDEDDDGGGGGDGGGVHISH